MGGWPSLARLLFVRRRGAAPLCICGSELAGLPRVVGCCCLAHRYKQPQRWPSTAELRGLAPACPALLRQAAGAAPLRIPVRQLLACFALRSLAAADASWPTVGGAPRLGWAGPMSLDLWCAGLACLGALHSVAGAFCLRFGPLLPRAVPSTSTSTCRAQVPEPTLTEDVDTDFEWPTVSERSCLEPLSALETTEHRGPEPLCLERL